MKTGDRAFDEISDDVAKFAEERVCCMNGLSETELHDLWATLRVMIGDDVVYFETDASAALFASADVKTHFWTICRYFVAEEFLTYCGIASAVTVLNSLGVDSPEEPQIYPYKLFTQDNFFTDEVLHHRRPVQVEKSGNTLEQLAEIVSVFEVSVETCFANDLSLEQCRGVLVKALSDPNQRIICDFGRKVLHQRGDGHFSPLAAYHSGEDRFLLMDVARYKYAPCWVRFETLYEALLATDSVSGASRGFLIVSAM